MKRVATYQLIPGMKVAEDIYNYNRQLILPKGTVLTDDTITRLDFYSIISVYVEDIPVSTNKDSNAEFFTQSYSQRLQASPEFQKFKEKL